MNTLISSTAQYSHKSMTLFQCYTPDSIDVLMVGWNNHWRLLCVAKTSVTRMYSPCARKHLFCGVSSTVFWGLYFLIYSALTLYITRVVDHHFAGITIPVPFYGAIESLGVVMLGFVMGTLWLKLRQKGHDLSTPGKLTLGFVLMTITMGDFVRLSIISTRR